MHSNKSVKKSVSELLDNCAICNAVYVEWEKFYLKTWNMRVKVATETLENSLIFFKFYMIYGAHTEI